MSRIRRPVAAALAALLLGGCAGVPDGSSPRVVGEVPNTAFNDVPDIRSQPAGPEPGAAPKDIVNGFLTASGSPDKNYAIARTYLTRNAAKSWQDEAGVVILADRPYLSVQQDGREVALRQTEEHGRLDSTGSYSPSSGRYNHSFQLEKENGEWRIVNPPAGLVITERTFQQSFQRHNTYFLNPSGSRVVPDPRWIAAPRESEANVLVKALIDGPSQQLVSGVRNALGEGVTVASNVVPDQDRVRVYLSGLGQIGPQAIAQAVAQIVWTLNEIDVSAVEIYDDDTLVEVPGVGGLQRFGDWGSYSPSGLQPSTPGYFVRSGAIWTTAGKAVPGPAGTGAYGAVTVGVSGDLSRLAVVGQVGTRRALYVGGAARGQLTERIRGGTLTAPSWGGKVDAVWTVRDGREVMVVPTNGQPTTVAGEVGSLGGITALRVSRDGTRVALVAGDDRTVYIGTVVQKAGDISLDRLTAIAPGLTGVADLSWSSADQLVVLVKGGQSEELASVAIDGSEIDQVGQEGLPEPPAAVAAAPQLPLLAAAERSIWKAQLDRSWTPVVGTVAVPGSAPVYPG